MPATKAKFRTIQDDYFDDEEIGNEEPQPQTSNWKLILVLGLGFVMAASLATLLSVAI